MWSAEISYLQADERHSEVVVTGGILANLTDTVGLVHG